MGRLPATAMTAESAIRTETTAEKRGERSAGKSPNAATTMTTLIGSTSTDTAGNQTGEAHPVLLPGKTGAPLLGLIEKGGP